MLKFTRFQHHFLYKIIKYLFLLCFLKVILFRKKLRMKNIFIFTLLFVIQLTVFSQKTRISRAEYIAKYSDWAIREMKRNGIPASITLAQACLESDDGNSWLASEANNHFGIKCHSTWTGDKVYKDDDDKNECFRKYFSAKESFDDHSDFLVNTKRYAALFNLNSRDYKAWAKGLKDAGYATNPKYPEYLIKIIEDNKLYEFDKRKRNHINNSDTATVKHKRKQKLSDVDGFSFTISGREIKLNNRIKYILAKTGDTPDALAKELDMFTWELLKYNDLTNDSILRQGQVIYIQPKRNKAEFGKNTHTVKEDETLYSISQYYGIKLNKLKKKNNLNSDSINIGSVLNLRIHKFEKK